MNKLVWIALAVTLVAVAGGGFWWWQGSNGDEPAADRAEPVGRYRAGEFRLSLALDPPAPRPGENRLSIELGDAGGAPVSGAELRAIATMPAMGAMPEMRASTRFEEPRPGRYVGAFELPMSGEWPLTLEISKTGLGGARLSFDMATGRRGLQLTSGGETVGGDDSGTAAAADGHDHGAPRPAPRAGAAPSITVDARRRQMIGVEIGTAERRELARTIRAVGRIVYDETALSDVTLRFDGWIGELKADFVGTRVRRGETLFTVYGPGLLAAQQEYLSAYRRGTRLAYGGDGLLAAARKRLELWDIGDDQIRALERRGEPLDYLPVASPRDGTVVAKHIVAGSAVKAGQTLMRVADLSRVWIDAEIYEAELPLVREGMAAEVALPYLPGARFDARVDYVYPYLEDDSRTARLRLTLNNPQGALKPDMYAEVRLQADLGERLAVSEDAVLVAGERRVVFVDLGEGRLQPVRVTTGQRAQGYIEILDGLSAGDRIVTSGVFLIASETKLKAGMEQW
jgi:Cu(I)/Ag(I) efflux system membrane fusion protein